MSHDLPPSLPPTLPSALQDLLVHENAPLGPLTSLGVGGPAPWVIEPRDRDELGLAVKELSAAGLPFRLLGHGSNLLVSDRGVPEVVLHTRELRQIVRDAEREHALRVETGVSLARVVSVAHELGLTGAERLIGIPGTLGGAVAGNAGSSHGAIGDLLVEVTVIEPDGTTTQVTPRPEQFSYRSSPLRGRVVLDAVLQLEPANRKLVFQRMTEILKAKSESQPLTARSAGCMFRNAAPDADGKPRASGKLIDEAGCKGLSVGGAQVSPRHANFIVNTGDAAADDVVRLVERVRQAVRERSGVDLDLEVERWGDFAETERTVPRQ